MMEVLTEEGYTAVLGTNCEQTYERYLRVGEQLRVTTALDSVAGPKNTAMGEGYFVTSRNTWYVGDESCVATMLFRVLKFIPRERRMTARHPADGRTATRSSSGTAPRPASCGSRSATPAARCGSRPARPARPAAPSTAATSSPPARGTVFSYVVHRHPPVPGKELPIVIALIDLDEGVRMVGEVVDVADDEIEIGMRLRVDFQHGRRRADPADLEASMRTLEAGQAIPEWSLPMTPTTIVSTAIATRDWQDVHHDRDVAQAAGSKDIFMNILTTNGLVERFVADWAGHDAELKGIAIRLGAPAHPYDTLTFTGTVADGRATAIATIDVVGRVSLGDHVTGTVQGGAV